MKRKALSLLLALTVICGAFPVTAFADELVDEPVDTTEDADSTVHILDVAKREYCFGEIILPGETVKMIPHKAWATDTIQGGGDVDELWYYSLPKEYYTEDLCRSELQGGFTAIQTETVTQWASDGEEGKTNELATTWRNDSGVPLMLAGFDEQHDLYYEMVGYDGNNEQVYVSNDEKFCVAYAFEPEYLNRVHRA